MAELVLKIGAGANYEDGDVLCAFNRRRIRCCHAQMIAHPWKAGLARSGLRPNDSVCERFYRLTHQFEFQRVSETEVRKTDLTADLKPITIGPTRNKDGEHIYIEEFLKRRLRSKAPDGGPKLAIFGEPGAERWYGGRIDFAEPKVEAAWDMIEEQTALLRTNHDLWPAGVEEMKVHLYLPVDDFADVEAERLVAPWLDERDPENPVTVKKRNVSGDWHKKELLDRIGVKESDVLDTSKTIDKREPEASVSDVLDLRDKRESEREVHS